MDNENNYNHENQDPASNDYGGSYHYDFDLNQEKQDSTPPQPDGFSSAALVLGILSLVLCCCCYVSIPLGALGILFAILSKRGGLMSGRSRAGLGLSIAGLCLTLLMTVSMVLTVLRDDTFWQTLEDTQKYYQGEDYDSDDLEDFFREYEEYFQPHGGQEPDAPEGLFDDAV